jgi:GTP-binding protein Era
MVYNHGDVKRWFDVYTITDRINMKKCGFVAILGCPNAGKSTLTNKLVGSKVSIVSSKVQTTRQRVTGIAMHQDTQIVFLDTPGIFDPKKSLEVAIVNNALSVIEEAEVFIVLMDVAGKNTKESLGILDKINNNKPILTVLNKIDKISPEKLLAFVDQIKSHPKVKDVFMISALKGDGTNDLLQKISELLPASEWLYPEDEITDVPTRLWAAEITREKLYLALQHELPYETYVETEQYETFDNGSVKISQVIVVARDTQKPIIVGRAGSMIGKIGQAARKEMEYLLGHRVHLKLFVKVRKDWMDKKNIRREIGLES